MFAFLFVCLFVCLYGWGCLNAGWCDRREILAQGRANTGDGNEVVRGWSAHGGPGVGGWTFFGVRVLTFVNRTATFCFCLSVIKCSPILRGYAGARFDAKFFKSAKGFLHGGPKNTIICTFLTISGVYFLVSQKRQRISAHKQYQK